MDLSEPIQLFGLDQQGKSAVVTAQRHLNLYAEIKQEQEKSTVVFYGTPGLTSFAYLGDTPVRGWLNTGTLFYAVHRDKLIEVNNAGTQTERGTLSTSTGRVGMAYDGSVILIVDGTAGYTYTVSTVTLATIVDAQFPNGAKTCDWLDSQFIVDNGDDSDLFYISANGTDWADFAAAESAPDGLRRVFVDHGEILLFGTATVEPWGNIGAEDFTFAPIKGSIMQVGLAARWSAAKFNDGVAFLGKSPQGKLQVYQLQGYAPRPISSPEMDYIINGYATTSDATGFAYLLGGHPMYQINFPTEGKSWLYDASTGLWSPLEYGLEGARHRGEMALDFLGKTLIADYSTGDIYDLDPDTYTDNGEYIAREIVGRHIFRGNDRITIDELFVDFETGVGLVDGQGEDPQVMLQISKDGGKTFGTELWASLGMIGKYLTRLVWRRLGLARDWTFKLRITDPCKVVITYAAMRAR
jgi:hypothetical protein